MRIYIAGPMRGYPDFNFPAFFDAEARAQALGHEVENPARMDIESGFDATRVTEEEADGHLREFYKRDCAALLRVDAIAMLPGWTVSRGAVAEYCMARWLRLTILDARTFEPLEHPVHLDFV